MQKASSGKTDGVPVLKRGRESIPLDRKYVSVRFSHSQLRKRNKELSILLEMSNFLAGSSDLEPLLSGALAKVLAHFHMEAGRIYLADEKGENLCLTAHQGLQPYGLEKESVNEGFSGKAFRTKSFIAQHVSDLEDKGRVAVLLEKGFKVIICVPLITMGRVKGVMNLATGDDGLALDQDRIDLLTAIGNQIAVAINNATLYQALMDKIQALKEQKEKTKYIAYSVSHDLKSPATSLYGLARRLKTRYGEHLDDRAKEHCEQIMKAAKDMVALVEDINAYVSSKERPLHLEMVPLKEITEAVRNEFAAKIRQRGIKWTEPSALPEIRADKMALIRVFRNLVDNSIKHGGAELREIEIGCREEKDHHVVSFRDDGVGIKEMGSNKIFDRFERQESARQRDGSGLGLAIVKEIVERHNGWIRLDTHTHKGTLFHFAISKDPIVSQSSTPNSSLKGDR